jgi:hypothetical protein
VKTPKQDQVTEYGFTWGPMDVTRACADGRYRTLLIRTPHAELQVSVSPTGRSIRTYQSRRQKK